MGTLHIYTDGEHLFSYPWDPAVAAFPDGKKFGKVSGEEFARECVRKLSLEFLADMEARGGRNGLRGTLWAVAWYIGEREWNDPDHPGKVRDYLLANDVEVNLHDDGIGVEIEMTMTRRFNS